MLVLARNFGEKIIIKDTDSCEKIEIVLIRQKGSETVVGITAAKKFKIYRDEIAAQIKGF